MAKQMMTNRSNQSKPAGSIPTTWELRTYDVWGNATDGYEVNDSYSSGTITLRIPQTRHNAGLGTSAEFVSATPSDRQIKLAFNVTCRIDADGDDITIYVNRRRDGYPIGEMHCTSHASLSPVRPLGLCAVCGQSVSLTGGETADGRVIASCGDAMTKEQWEYRS